MSYLEQYHNSRSNQSEAEGLTKLPLQTSNHHDSGVLQAKYKYLQLKSSIAQGILTSLDAVQAVDISHNSIDEFPHHLSPNLLALDVSYNLIERPLILTSEFNLIELNLSNNRISDMRGLTLLITLEYLNVSENQISRVDGLENMKNLRALKLQFNRISSFQNMRLLTYNSELKEMWLEGNPIEHDTFYKIKLLNCVPNLKTLDGATVWRRTSLQSRIVNDDLKYTDLCARTPASVDKYAELSRRSAIQQSNTSILNNLSGTMLTLKAVGSNPLLDKSMLSQPEQTRLPSDLRNLSSLEGPAGSYSGKKITKRAVDVPPLIAGELSTHCDISLLPAHLQETLRQQHQRLTASPRRTSTERALLNSAQAGSTGAGSGSVNGAAIKSQASSSVVGSASVNEMDNTNRPPRSRSALPWRNPPSVTPNYNTRVLTRRSGREKDRDDATVSTAPAASSQKAQSATRSNTPSGTHSANSTAPSSRTRAVAHSGSRSAQHSVTSGGEEKHNATTAVRHRGQAAEPRAPSPSKASPVKNGSANVGVSQSSVSAAAQSSESSQWMNPQLNLALTARATPGKYRYQQPPPSPGFDSRLMESTNSSSLCILQQSFDFDKRSVGDLSSLRGRSRTRNERASSTPRSIATSVSPSGTRSVTQTRTSLSRASFSAEMLRAQQEEERVARELAEARTFSRPGTPTPSHSPYPYGLSDQGNERNATYTIFRGTSPTKHRGDDQSPGNFSPTASVSRALSPQRISRHDSFGSRSVAASVTSPSRLASVDRILRAYGVEPLPVPPEPLFRPSASQVSLTSRHSAHSAAPTASSSYAVSDESKQPSEQGSPTAAGRDESPYRRFLKLRDRLSNKFMQPEPTSAAHGAGQPREGPEPSQEAPKRSPRDHTYDFIRKIDIESMDPDSNPDLGEIESKIVELQQQDMQFRQLKEQYQQQYQQEYEQAMKDRNVALVSSNNSVVSSSSTAKPVERAAIQSGSSNTMKQSSITQSPQNTPGVPPPPPPVGAGYDVLYDLIHRRRTVLENITQPRELSPDKSHRPKGTDNQDIRNAISGLKHRQEASVNVVQSMTRDRVVPLPARDSLAQVTLSTPALHPSISNYMFMAESTSPGASSPPGTRHNSFLTRLATNNPYMQALSNPASGASLSGGLGVMGDMAGVSQGVSQSYAPPQAYVPAPVPFVPHASGILASAPSQSYPAPAPQAPAVNALVSNGHVNTNNVNNSLAVAIQNLQAKQARDLVSLKRS